ncbi:hypothetical protein CCAL6883_03250, partial [Campylobacter sp. RM6883]|nr:hypothetical protein [Campylobacter sp. RM6883]
MFKNLNISTKLTLMSCGMALAALLLVIIIVASKTLGMSERNTSQYIQSEMGKNAEKVSAFFSKAMQTSRVLSETIGGALDAENKLTTDSIGDIFYEVAKNNTEFLAVWMMTDSEEVYSKSQDGGASILYGEDGKFAPYVTNLNGTLSFARRVAGYEKADYYTIPKNTGEPTILEPFFYNYGGQEKLVTTAVSPIIVSGKFVGVVGITLDVANIQKLCDSIHLYDGDVNFLVSHTGKFIVHKETALIGKSMVDVNPALKPIESALQKEEPIEIEVVSAVTKKLSKVVYVNIEIPHFDKIWGMVLIAPKDETVKETNELRNFIIILAVVSMLILSFAMWSYSKTFGKRIVTVGNNLENFFEFLNFKTNKADLITIRANDEIGKMGMLINENIKMTERNLAEQNAFIKEANSFVDEIKRGNFMAMLDAQTINPALNQLKGTFKELQEALKTAIAANAQDVLKLLEAYKNQNFTETLDDKGEVASGVNALGSEIANMLKANLSQ